MSNGAATDDDRIPVPVDFTRFAREFHRPAGGALRNQKMD